MVTYMLYKETSHNVTCLVKKKITQAIYVRVNICK